MKIAVIGTGYVGLVAGACLAESGHQVTCVDINKDRIAQLRDAVVPFFEPGLEDLVRRNSKKKRLSFTTDAGNAIQSANVVFVAVGTPSSKDGSSDLTYVIQVIKTIAENLKSHKVIVIKSTVPIGTSKKLREILKKETSQPYALVSNPEFLKEGDAVNDFLKPERVVIGSDDLKAIEIMKELYDPFVRSGNPMLVMDNTSAELSKYACNSFLAMKISFINEMANLCDRLGANINAVRQTMMTDSRIGKKFLYPGTGYGGSCFPKDVRALLHTAGESDYPLKIVSVVEEVNQKQKEILVQMARHHFKGKLKGKTFAIWGLSFKPNTDDLREAPSLTVIRELLREGALVRAYDPISLSNAKELFGNTISYCNDPYECLSDAEALFILTEWNEFRKPNIEKLKSLLKSPTIFDGRNLFGPKEMTSAGFVYRGVGLS